VRCTSLAITIGIAFIETFAAAVVTAAPPLPIDEALNRSEGIRKLASRHLVLYTDVPSEPEVDELPAAFDQAVPQWAKYFGIDDKRAEDFQARAFLIADRRRFESLGLLPAGHEQFVNGISINRDLWLHDQPTAYYRRHLLLHEGTHAFMVSYLGGCGPGWYMEGSAELLATHRINERTGELTLRIMPRDRVEVPMLGRIKLIRDAFDSGRLLSVPAVMRIDNRKQLGNEAYAWCWAAARFLDSHPRYRDRFRSLKEYVLDHQFNDIVRRQYVDDWSDLTAEWPAYIATLDHGYDFARMAIEFRAGKLLRDSPQKVTIAADRGWQSSGVRLEANKSYRIVADGRYQIAAEKTGDAATPWPCEPGGVTIEYHNGKPLGMLLGAIDGRDDAGQAEKATLADAIAIGLEATVSPPADGTLYLRVNDSAGRLGDNSGTLTVTISPSD
jgi:hypothetical protein